MLNKLVINLEQLSIETIEAIAKDYGYSQNIQMDKNRKKAINKFKNYVQKSNKDRKQEELNDERQ